jgi:outer membrane protein OmpA-like peptidoglycan-associated protein
MDDGDKPIVIRVEKDKALEALEAQDRAEVEKPEAKKSKRTLFSIFKRFNKSQAEEPVEELSSENDVDEKVEDVPAGPSQRYLFGNKSVDSTEEEAVTDEVVEKKEKRRWFFFKKKEESDNAVAEVVEKVQEPAPVAEVDVEIPQELPKKKKSFSLFKFGKKEDAVQEERAVIEEEVPSIFKKGAHNFSVVEENTESSSLPERLPGDKVVRKVYLSKSTPVPVLRPKRAVEIRNVASIDRKVEVLEERAEELSQDVAEVDAVIQSVVADVKEVEPQEVVKVPEIVDIATEEVAIPEPELPVIEENTLVVEDQSILDIPTPEEIAVEPQEEKVVEAVEALPDVPSPAETEVPEVVEDVAEVDISLEEVFPEDEIEEEVKAAPAVADSPVEVSSEEAQIEAAQDEMIARLKEENVHPDLAHEVRMVFSVGNVELTDEMKEAVKIAVERWKDLGKRWQVMSYATKTDGMPNSDRRIALQRAIAVRSYLIEAGVSSLLINVQALGQKEEYTAVDEVVIKLIP